MPQAEYIIQTEHTSGSTAKHYHGVSISTLNTWAASNIPSNAVVSNIEVYYSGKLSLGDTKFYVGFTNDSSSEPGQKIISDQLTTSKKSWQQPLPFSGRNINASYSVLSVYMNSGIIYKKFTCYSFKVIYTYSIPTYTLTVNAGTGGTVTGGGTFEIGTTATITATPNTGYAFVKWSDGSTEKSRTITVTGNATYTAEFTLITFEVTVGSREGVNRARATVSGGGQYKFGDTITIKAEIPPYHEFYAWDCNRTTGYFKENPLVITLDERFCNGDNALVYITFNCQLQFTGYTLKANVLPDNLDIDSYRIEWTYSDRPDRWEPIMDRGVVITRTTLASILEEVVPEIQIRARTSYNGYEFVQWADESPQKYQNPRTINLTGDATFTAIYKKKPPEFTSASVTYLNKQVSASNKVICGEGFIISVGVT